jgi:hypothetical protein
VDYFENIVATLLEADGYWVRGSFKVDVTKEEKKQIGKHTIPRPEIDLLALRVQTNQVIAFEAKSYLDSSGVKLFDLQQEHEVPEGRYKLFTSKRYRDIVLSRLLEDLISKGMANKKTTIRLGLAAGRVYRQESTQIRQFMNQNSWIFWSPEDIKERVTQLAQHGYENNAAMITAKILLRDQEFKS